MKIRARDLAKRVIQILRVNKNVRYPEYQTEGAAGFDIESAISGIIHPGETVLMPSGLKMAIPEGLMLDIRPRSGLSLRWPNYIANSPGTIDPDYRGEIQVAIRNNTEGNIIINAGDRIAQGVLVPFVRGWLLPVVDLPPTERGEGGYGHTGV